MLAKKKRATKRKEPEITPEKIAHWVFLFGMAVSVIAGLILPQNATITWMLALLGLIVGAINVTLKDEVSFLLAVLSLGMFMSLFSMSLATIPAIGPSLAQWVQGILSYIVIFMAPAGIVVALEAIYYFARD